MGNSHNGHNRLRSSINNGEWKSRNKSSRPMLGFWITIKRFGNSLQRTIDLPSKPCCCKRTADVVPTICLSQFETGRRVEFNPHPADRTSRCALAPREWSPRFPRSVRPLFWQSRPPMPARCPGPILGRGFQFRSPTRVALSCSDKSATSRNSSVDSPEYSKTEAP